MTIEHGIPTNGRHDKKQGRSWAWGIGGFYVLFVLCTLSFVLFASSQRTDLVSEDYYQREIGHQQHIDMVRRTASLADGIAWSLRREGDDLVCRFPPEPTAQPISGHIHLYRPSDARQDRQWAIALNQAGEQRLPLGGLAAGWWTVKINWSMGGETYYAEEPFNLER